MSITSPPSCTSSAGPTARVAAQRRRQQPHGGHLSERSPGRRSPVLDQGAGVQVQAEL
jgi:hypothetical protein